jgi:hypothetical protein
VAFDAPLNAASAQNGDYALFLGVKKGKKYAYTKIVPIGSVVYDGNVPGVRIALARPTKGKIEVVVHGGIYGANGAVSSGAYTTYVEG